ncbi:traN-like protein, partial [Escherichia coli]|nr:traN-like protein [Escherichia coli]
MKPTTPFKNPGAVRDTSPPPRQQPDITPDLLAESEAVNIQEQVQQLYDEQQQLINDPYHLQDSQTDAGNIEQEYNDAVEAAVADKETQAENLE